MEPVDQFDICIFSWFYKLAQIGGIDLFAEKFKPNALTYTTISALCSLLLSCTWTIYTYDIDEKIICSAMLAFNCQVKSENLMISHSSVREFDIYFSRVLLKCTAS